MVNIYEFRKNKRALNSNTNLLISRHLARLPMMPLWACSKKATEIGRLDFARAELVKTEFLEFPFCIFFCILLFPSFIYITGHLYFITDSKIPFIRFQLCITDYRNKWSGEGQDIVKLITCPMIILSDFWFSLIFMIYIDFIGCSGISMVVGFQMQNDYIPQI